jgi:hypothetical protein
MARVLSFRFGTGYSTTARLDHIAQPSEHSRRVDDHEPRERHASGAYMLAGTFAFGRRVGSGYLPRPGLAPTAQIMGIDMRVIVEPEPGNWFGCLARVD